MVVYGSRIGDIVFVGVIYYIFNYVFMKVFFFFIVGVVIYEFGMRNFNELSGLVRIMLKIMFVFFIGVVVIIGMLLLNGFVSKWFIYESFVIFNLVFGVIVIIGIVFCMVVYVRVFYIFFGRLSEKVMNVRDLEVSMFWLMIILVLVIIIMGFFLW